VVRILTGALWLVHAIPKFVQSDDFMPPSGASVGFVAKALQSTDATSPYHAFLANVVQPNIGIFAELARLGEVLVGVALVLGVLTRLGGLGGMFLTLNYMAAAHGFSSFAAWSTLDAAMLLLSSINLVLPTGRVLGIDMFFGKHAAPPPPTVRAVFVDEPQPAPPPPAPPPSVPPPNTTLEPPG